MLLRVNHGSAHSGDCCVTPQMHHIHRPYPTSLHFVGWMFFEHKDMSIIDFMQNWLWLYTHQTDTV